jgi:hypothetical protein
LSPLRSRGALAWVLALAAGWAALAVTGYGARDPDSRLYAEIAARQEDAPLARWIAPEFPPGWYMSGLFREHPAGLFAPASALAALGYPAGQAAYAANALYQVLGIVLLQRLAATLVAGFEARALAWLVQLLPIAFTYRIRANHEAAMLLCLLAALYGTERARREPRFGLLVAAGLVGLLLVKGLLAAFGPALCALWLLARRAARLEPGVRDRTAWIAVAAGVLVMAATAVAYEVAYRHATGEPFWPYYAGRQLGVAAGAGGDPGPGGPLYNLVFYLARVLWFAFPWSVALFALLWTHRRPSREAGGAGARGTGDASARAGVVFALALAALYVGLFSLSDRRADRYIFPAYYAVGAAGAVAALRLLPPLRRLAERLDRPWVPAAAWAATFAAHLFAGRLGLPTVKIWAP